MVVTFAFEGPSKITVVFFSPMILSSLSERATKRTDIDWLVRRTEAQSTASMKEVSAEMSWVTTRPKALMVAFVS